MAIKLTSFNILFAASSIFCVPLALQAQDLEPRSYTNLPIGQHFIAAGYANSSGEVSPSPSAPVEDAKLDIDAYIVGYATSFSLFGSSAKFDTAVSRSCFTGSARLQGDKVSVDRCGYTDPTFRLSWNFFGAPAMEIQDFSAWHQGLVIGASMQVTAPLGSYQTDKLLNSGANRWVYRPGVGMSHRIGRWYYDIIASIRFYGDNDEYLGDGQLSQDPQVNLQAHLIYNFNRGHWLSLNGNFFFGGETVKNGIQSDDDQQNSRFGLTYSYSLTAKHSLKLSVSTGVLTRYGNDFDTYGLMWQYRL
ncbi:transporter [Shewanella waksmanii]|uniref:transporter n=1 Tax=Shewanella waksmanii TaxID=213783 RepID=UPI0037356547